MLSDRIAIMAHGALRAYGTAAFLKGHFGIGYRLTATKASPPAGSTASTRAASTAPLLALIREHVPAASVIEDSKRAVEVQLPGSDTGLFRCLFEALEAHAESVGVEDFGVNTTTLEDVFLKVNQLVLNTAPRAQAEGTSDLRLLTASRVRGTPLGALSGMLAKKRINAQRDWGFSSCQCLFPPLMMLFAILLLNDIRLDLTLGPPITLLPDEAMPLKYARPVPLVAFANTSDARIAATNLTGWGPQELRGCSGVVDCSTAGSSSAAAAAGAVAAGAVQPGGLAGASMDAEALGWQQIAQAGYHPYAQPRP